MAAFNHMDVLPKTVYAAQPVEDARDSAYSTFQIVVPIPSCKNGRKKFPFGKQLTIYLSTEINYNEYDDPMSVSVKTVFGPCQILEVMPVYMHVPYQTGIIVDMPKEENTLPNDPVSANDYPKPPTQQPSSVSSNGASTQKKGDFNYAFLPLSMDHDDSMMCEPVRKATILSGQHPPQHQRYGNENIMNGTMCCGGPRCQNVPHQIGDQHACLMRRPQQRPMDTPPAQQQQAAPLQHSPSTTHPHVSPRPHPQQPSTSEMEPTLHQASPNANKRRRQASGESSMSMDETCRSDSGFSRGSGGDNFMARGEMKQRAPQFQKTLAFYRKKIAHSYMDELLRSKSVDAVVARGPTHVTCKLCDTRLLFKGSSMVQHVYKHCNADLFKCSSCNFASHFSCVVIQHSRLIHPSADPFYFHDLRNHHDDKLAQLVIDCYAEPPQ